MGDRFDNLNLPTHAHTKGDAMTTNATPALETTFDIQRSMEKLSDVGPFLSVVRSRGQWSVNLSCSKASVLTLDASLAVALAEAFAALRWELNAL